MKTETWKPMKYLAGLLAVILLITSMPVSAHAAEAPTGTQKVTVQHEYDITSQNHSNQKGAMKDDPDALNGQAFRIAYGGNGNSADLKSHFQLKSETFCRVYYTKSKVTHVATPDATKLAAVGKYHLYPLVWSEFPNPGEGLALNICSSQHAKADGAATAAYKMKSCSSGVYLSMKLEGEYSSDNDAYTAYWFDKIVIEATHTLEEYEYTPATCGSDATITGTCTTCSQTVTGTPEGYTRPDHTYSDYESGEDGNAVATCSGCQATDTITDAPVFHSASISTKGNIAVNYYTKLPTSVLNSSDAAVTFTVDGDKTEIPVSQGTKATLGGLPYYVFSCQVPAKQMTDTITATCGDVTAAEFSVRAYADIILNGEYSDGLKSLVTSMLHYGAYAQQHFGHNTGSLANAGLAAADLSSVTAEALKAYASTSVGPTGAKFYGCSLILESETTLRFFFKVSEGATLTVNGGELEVKTRGDYQYVDIKNISAKDLGTAITLSVSDGTETAEVKASPLTYCYNVLSAEAAYDTELVELVKALYLYYVQADAYFN